MIYMPLERIALRKASRYGSTSWKSTIEVLVLWQPFLVWPQGLGQYIQSGKLLKAFRSDAVRKDARYQNDSRQCRALDFSSCPLGGGGGDTRIIPKQPQVPHKIVDTLQTCVRKVVQIQHRTQQRYHRPTACCKDLERCVAGHSNITCLHSRCCRWQSS